MDYYAVNNLNLPIELMMENAGIHLAQLVSGLVGFQSTIKIGVGKGNNGGGGMVAARRLLAWGFNVTLDIPFEINSPLLLNQLDRAKKFGAKLEVLENPDVWVDAYFGFSQRLPLPPIINERIKKANALDCIRISLDLPSGLNENGLDYFHSSHVLSLAASKKVLFSLNQDTKIFLADLGIPKSIYDKFNSIIPPFHLGEILELERE